MPQQDAGLAAAERARRADEGLAQALRMVVRILRGENPASIPVYQVTKYGIALNLRTARANGIVIPPSVLVQATEVIE